MGLREEKQSLVSNLFYLISQFQVVGFLIWYYSLPAICRLCLLCCMRAAIAATGRPTLSRTVVRSLSLSLSHHLMPLQLVLKKGKSMASSADQVLNATLLLEPVRPGQARLGKRRGGRLYIECSDRAWLCKGRNRPAKPGRGFDWE